MIYNARPLYTINVYREITDWDLLFEIYFQHRMISKTKRDFQEIEIKITGACVQENYWARYTCQSWEHMEARHGERSVVAAVLGEMGNYL